jgi:AcrR family transcriptional regulator
VRRFRIARGGRNTPSYGLACRASLAEETTAFFLHGARVRPDASATPSTIHTSSSDEYNIPAPIWPPHIANLLGTASVYFCERGFQAASLEEISRLARVGRGTLARHFANKAGLFKAAMLDMSFRAVPADVPPLTLDGDLEDALSPFLLAASEHLTNLPSIALHRAVIAESRRDPELARNVYGIARTSWTKPLANWLSEQTARNRISDGDPNVRAMQLLTLATTGNRWLSSGETPDNATRGETVRRAITIFLDGFTRVL